MANQQNIRKFYPLTADELLYLCQILTDTELKTLLYLKTIHPFTDNFKEVDTAVIAEQLNVSRRSIQRFLKKFKDLRLINIEIKQVKQIELEICERLHSELGGLNEVSTPVGFIDLLTETEIIEIKNIKDWKGALGQILTYSAYYPLHKKRVHLFGRNLDKLPDIKSACLPFNVVVTGEEVKNG